MFSGCAGSGRFHRRLQIISVSPEQHVLSGGSFTVCFERVCLRCTLRVNLLARRGVSKSPPDVYHVSSQFCRAIHHCLRICAVRSGDGADPAPPDGAPEREGCANTALHATRLTRGAARIGNPCGERLEPLGADARELCSRRRCVCACFAPRLCLARRCSCARAPCSRTFVRSPSTLSPSHPSWPFRTCSCAGRVTFVAPHGHYSLKDTVLELEFNGERKKYTMMQVRSPAPLSLLLCTLRRSDLIWQLHQGACTPNE